MGTTARFTLFFGTLLVSTIPYYQWFAEYTLNFLPDIRDCQLIPVPQVTECPAQVNRYNAAIESLVAGILVIAAVVGYLFHPQWYLQRTRSVPLRDSIEFNGGRSFNLSGLGAEIPGLARRAGVPQPTFWVRKKPQSEARSLGWRGSYSIVLNFGLARLHGHHPQVVRGTILHELAHLRRHDVDLTRLALAAWWAFVAMVFLPLAGQAVLQAIRRDQARSWFAVGQLWSAAVLLLVVYLALRAVIRAREFQADLHAAELDRASIIAALTFHKKRPDESAFRRLWAAIKEWRELHPSALNRVAVVNNPSLLSKSDTSDTFVAALAAGLAFSGVEVTFRRLTNDGFQSVALAALVLGFLFSAVFAAWALRTSSSPWGFRLAVAATAGLLAGQSLAWDLPTLNVSWDGIIRVSPSHGLTLVVVLLIGLCFFTRIVSALALLWVTGRPTAVRSGAILVTLVAAGAFCVLFTFWRSLHNTELSVPRLFGWAQTSLLINTPWLVPTVLISAAVFAALSGRFRREALRNSGERRALATVTIAVLALSLANFRFGGTTTVDEPPVLAIDFGVPQALDLRHVCEWLPSDYGAALGVTGDEAWVGPVLARSPDPRIAQIGDAVVQATQKGDTMGAFKAMTAIGALCIVLDPAPAHVSDSRRISHDQCLVGNWRLAEAAVTLDFSANGLGPVSLTNVGGYTATFHSDGTGTDVRTGYSLRGAFGTKNVLLTRDSDARYHWSAGHGLFLQRLSAVAESSVAVDGVTTDSRPAKPGEISWVAYECAADGLIFSGGGYVERFTRL
ncbi:M48 family metalloprotease [Acrocarpospora macrocephala]|uniref:M48 family metalloprotease n=1 Tax=Acrocarpospora macrocephala TaxID=150177 RepID=UPI0014790194|nr:M48 family metalloprotease [Acrocarpospora macrocephala]